MFYRQTHTATTAIPTTPTSIPSEMPSENQSSFTVPLSSPPENKFQNPSSVGIGSARTSAAPKMLSSEPGSQNPLHSTNNNQLHTSPDIEFSTLFADTVTVVRTAPSTANAALTTQNTSQTEVLSQDPHQQTTTLMSGNIPTDNEFPSPSYNTSLVLQSTSTTISAAPTTLPSTVSNLSSMLSTAAIPSSPPQESATTSKRFTNNTSVSYKNHTAINVTHVVQSELNTIKKYQANVNFSKFRIPNFICEYLYSASNYTNYFTPNIGINRIRNIVSKPVNGFHSFGHFNRIRNSIYNCSYHKFTISPDYNDFVAKHSDIDSNRNVFSNSSSANTDQRRDCFVY